MHDLLTAADNSSLANTLIEPPESSASAQILGPPFQAPWKITRANPNVFWSALRSFVTRGQFVGQLGVRNSQMPRQFGYIEAGVQKRFRAQASGPHRIVIQVAAGPITRIGPASVFAFAFMDGVRRKTVPLYSHRSSYIVLNKNLVAGNWYTVVTAGFVSAFAGGGLPEAYGEVIASVPRITVFKPATALEGEIDHYFSSRNEQIEKLGDIEAVAAEIAGEEETEAECQHLSLEDALKAEASEMMPISS